MSKATKLIQIFQNFQSKLINTTSVTMAAKYKHSKNTLKTKAMRSANAYGCYAKTPEFRGILGSGNIVITVIIPLR